MDDAEKFQGLRYCVESEGDGGIAWFGTKERAELMKLIDTMEERWELFSE